jgi:hypothetical protein
MDKLTDELALDADLDLWQEDVAAEEMPSVGALFCISTFASISSIGSCVGTASCVGTLSCPG